jgi:RNA polymerase sigma factor (sigma-70 family)
MPSTTGDVNAAFAAYNNATDSHRSELRYDLIKSLEKYARSIVWLTLHEDHPEIVNYAIAVIMAHLGDFKGIAKFSTWVYQIVQRQCYEELRRKITDRKTLVSLDDHPAEDSATYELDGDAKFILDRLRQSLSDEENLLIDLKLQGHTSSEMAEILTTTTAAVESRWRRLCDKLEKTEKKRKATSTRIIQPN